MRWIITCALLLAACGDNSAKEFHDAGVDATEPDAPSGPLTGCLDTPGGIPLAPNGQLPCDLIPPGLSL